MIVCVKLTELEAQWLAHAIDLAAISSDQPSEFPGDWPRGERAAVRRMIRKLRAALPSKEETHANPR